MYNSAALYTFTVWVTPPSLSKHKAFHDAQHKLCSREIRTSRSSLLPAPLSFVSMNVPVLGASHKWIYVVAVLPRRAFSPSIMLSRLIATVACLGASFLCD